MTVEVPEPLAGRLVADAERRGIDPAELAVETLEGVYGWGSTAGGGAESQEALDAFIGCGTSGATEPFDIHAARSELAARKLAEGA